MKRINHHIIGWSLLLLFIGYMGALVAYSHFAVVDGILVVHAHKLSKEQKKAPFHNHSASELVLLQQISDFSISGLLTFISIVAPQTYRIIKFNIWEHEILPTILFSKIQLRAPPSLGF